MSILDRSGMARTLADWIDVESVTGGEEDFARAAASALESRGFAVELQRVDEGRYNVLARADAPSVVFCTHLDTVPPFIPPRIEGGTVYGRGACDAMESQRVTLTPTWPISWATFRSRC